MKRKGTIAVVTVVVWVMFAGTQLEAITNGQADGNGHPNVGVMVAEWRTPGVKDPVCTGTLVAPTVFLTAAHCDLTPDGIPADQVWVSFASVYQPGVSPVFHGTFVANPDYADSGPGGQSDPQDLAVIRLDVAPGIQPAPLPTAGLLSSQSLRRQRFTAVGYGDTRVDKTKGPNSFVGQSTRNVATQAFLSLEPSWLNLSMNPARGDGGDGGGCYGDSGGPHFLGDVIVSLTVIGDAVCRATDKTYRLDIESARRFLVSVGVPLP
jgi:hypothetical protein